MKTLSKILSVNLITLSLFGFAHAEEAEKDYGIKGEVELGILATSGNTTSTSFKGKVNLNQETESWKNEFLFDSLFKQDEVEDEETGKEETATSEQKYFASAQGNYKLDKENSALFVYGSYEDNRFSGYKYQSSIAVGYSDRLLETEKSFLDYSVGPGYAYAKTDDEETEDSTIVRLAGKYEFQFSETAKFVQTLSTEAATDTSSNTRSKSETAVSARLMESLTMKAAFVVNHNSHVEEDKKKADTETSITVVYLF